MSAMTSPFKDDCVHFRGDKPCRFKRLCEGCPAFRASRRADEDPHHQVPGPGRRPEDDGPPARASRRKYPRSHITWVVDAESVDLLAGNPFVDRVLPFGLGDRRCRSTVREFDVLICLDKEPGIDGPRDEGPGRGESSASG